jgi:hypothetical protein
MSANEPITIRLRIDQLERLLMFDYDPQSPDALFDICDSQGHVLRTGDITGPVTQVRLSGIQGEDLILMVIDGENSSVQPIPLRKAS